MQTLFCTRCIIGTQSKMATSSACYGDHLNLKTNNNYDPIKNLYKVVNEEETPLPRCWSSKDKCDHIGLSQNSLRVHYRGAGETPKDAASIRATHPIPSACGLYYYEVKIISKGRDGYMGIGLCAQGVDLKRLPGWVKDSYGFHGDDGHIFCNSGTGLPYGPTFTTGDVIGCGIDLIDNCCFFTKNGHFLGIAFTDVAPNLYPTVGMQTPGEIAEANFGQAPFVFDIEDLRRGLCHRERTTILNFPVADTYGQWQTTLHKMVSTYLVHHGYCSTAEAFANSTSQEIEEELASIRNRQKVQKLVLNGKLGEAIKLVKDLYPNLLDKNANLYFMLRVRQFIEVVNGSDTGLDDGDCRSGASSSIPHDCDDDVMHDGCDPLPPPPPGHYTPSPTTSGRESACWTNGKVPDAATETAHPTSVIQSTKTALSGMSRPATPPPPASLELPERNSANADGSSSVIHSNSNSNNNSSNNSSSSNGVAVSSPIITPPPPLTTSSSASSTHMNDFDVEMECVEVSSGPPADDDCLDGHSENGENVANGFTPLPPPEAQDPLVESEETQLKHDDNDDDRLDIEEDMEIESSSPRLICGRNSAAIEKVIFLGRELQQMSQNLRRELGKNKQNKIMLQEAFSLLAYNDPWNSPVGWQLDPLQREPVYQALNSAILEAHDLPRRSPMEVCVAHTTQLLDSMAKAGLGSCAFVNVDNILRRREGSPSTTSSSASNNYCSIGLFNLYASSSGNANGHTYVTRCSNGSSCSTRGASNNNINNNSSTSSGIRRMYSRLVRHRSSPPSSSHQ